MHMYHALLVEVSYTGMYIIEYILCNVYVRGWARTAITEIAA